MRASTRLAVVLLAGVAGAAPLRAQNTSARFDTARVRTFTLASVIKAAVLEVQVAQPSAAPVPTLDMLTRVIGRLDRPGVRDLPLSAVLDFIDSTRRAGLGHVARYNLRGVDVNLGGGDAADVDTLRRLMAAELRDALEARTPAISDDSVDLILEPLTALNFLNLKLSLAVSVEKLNRFERKYGPDAPKLNGAEVVLNYLAQWVPLFQPDDEGWPSRWEVVSSFVPWYLSIENGKATSVTAIEGGLRAYLWNRGWGGESGGVWRPGYVSFGVVLVGEQDGTFASPFRDTRRVGAFVGWGAIKLAYVSGPRSRLLFTRQLQVLPWVF